MDKPKEITMSDEVRHTAPHVVFDVMLAETWSSRPSDYQQAVLGWLDSQNITKRDLSRVEVYSGYVLCSYRVRDNQGRIVFDKHDPLMDTYRLEIDTQPPVQVLGL